MTLLGTWRAADSSGEIAAGWKYTCFSTQLAGCRSPHGALFHLVSIHLSGFGGPALIPLFSSCVSD